MVGFQILVALAMAGAPVSSSYTELVERVSVLEAELRFGEAVDVVDGYLARPPAKHPRLREARELLLHVAKLREKQRLAERDPRSHGDAFVAALLEDHPGHSSELRGALGVLRGAPGRPTERRLAAQIRLRLGVLGGN